jgi:hypothetical protein
MMPALRRAHQRLAIEEPLHPLSSAADRSRPAFAFCKLVKSSLRDGNWSRAAARPGMRRSNLHHLARRLGLR